MTRTRSTLVALATTALLALSACSGSGDVPDTGRSATQPVDAPEQATPVAEDAAEQLGVSRTVIREAVRVLESMGLITVRRRVGITVLPPENWNPFDPNIIRWRLASRDRLDHLQYLSELRSAIEPLAAKLAAVRATPEHCGALTAAVIGMSATAKAAATAKAVAGEAREKAADVVEDAREAVAEVVEDVREAAAEAIDEVRERVEKVRAGAAGEGVEEATAEPEGTEAERATPA